MKRTIFFSAVLFLSLYACTGNDSTKKPAPVVEKKDSIPLLEDSLPVIDTLPPTSVAATKAFDLKFNLQKGRSYVYTMDVDIDRETKDQKMSTGMNWKYIMEVLKEEKSIKTLKLTYDRVAMFMTMGGQKMEFSSDQKAGDPTNPLNMVSNIFSAIKGKSFTMNVNSKGEIADIEGFDKIGEALVGQMNLPEEAKARALQNFKNQFNDKVVKETFSQAFSIFPDKKIKVGDSWERETLTESGPARGRMITVYKLRQLAGTKAILSADSKLIPLNNGSPGKQTARLVVDTRTGLVLQNIFQLEIPGQKKMTSRGKITGKEL